MKTPQQRDSVLLSLRKSGLKAESTASWGFWISDGVHASATQAERLAPLRPPRLSRHGIRVQVLGKL